MDTDTYTDQQDWQQYYERHPSNKKPLPFRDIFETYLEENTQKKVLEIGCAGGDFLFYLYDHFHYQPYGIDYSDMIELTRIRFKEHKAPIPTLYKEDFLTWDTQEKFDLVCSFGFIEHFQNTDFIIQKHIDLLAPKGLCIITIPHFAHGQYFLHWLLDRDNLRLHNTKIMNLKFFENSLRNLPIDIVHLDYDGTFAFWTEKQKGNLAEKIAYRIIQYFGKLLILFLGNKSSNFIFSPTIVCVVQKR